MKLLEQNQPINVTVNSTTPEIIIGTPISGNSPKFQISIKEVAEIRVNNNNNYQVIRSFPLLGVMFFLNETYDGANKKLNYTASLPNDATLSIIISTILSYYFFSYLFFPLLYYSLINEFGYMWQFEETTQVELASMTSTFQPHTIKLNVKIDNWPFLSLSHSLSIRFNNDVADSENGESCRNEQMMNKGA